ncbi:MAG: hypothetical protein RLY35_1898 [Bacteroidota bacterium]|jgi:hypothetical protein
MSDHKNQDAPLRRKIGLFVFTVGLISSMIGYHENIIQNPTWAPLMLIPLFCFLLAILILQSTWDRKGK